MTYLTLLCDTDTNDLLLDSAGDIAVAENPYATAQDVGAILTVYKGEIWYDAERGMPWLADVGKAIPMAYIQQQAESAAMQHPGVSDASASATQSGRGVSLQVVVTLTDGTQLALTS